MIMWHDFVLTITENNNFCNSSIIYVYNIKGSNFGTTLIWKIVKKSCWQTRYNTLTLTMNICMKIFIGEYLRSYMQSQCYFVRYFYHCSYHLCTATTCRQQRYMIMRTAESLHCFRKNSEQVIRVES